MLNDVTISNYHLGALADVLKLHTDYYGTRWGFGRQFETQVAAEMAVFFDNFDPRLDQFLAAYDKQGECAGSISLNASRGAPGEHSQLRWFIVNPQCVGKGLGRELLARVITHCDNHRFEQVHLSTFAGLHAARSLYESFGFTLTQELDVDKWAGGVKEQRFVRHIASQLAQ